MLYRRRAGGGIVLGVEDGRTVFGLTLGGEICPLGTARTLLSESFSVSLIPSFNRISLFSGSKPTICRVPSSDNSPLAKPPYFLLYQIRKNSIDLET